jgi:hypothetical protein
MTEKEMFPGRGHRGGNVAERVKTDMRMPRFLVERVEEVCTALGLGKNAFFSMAGAMLALRFLPLIPGKKRPRLVRDLKRFLLKVIEEVESSL